jgi:hypothetical protein
MNKLEQSVKKVFIVLRCLKKIYIYKCEKTSKQVESKNWNMNIMEYCRHRHER